MPNTIAQNLARLQAARTAIAGAITAKGGTVTTGDGFEEFSADIATIPGASQPKPYLEFTGTEPFTLKTAYGKKWNGTIEYSTDKTTWTVWDGSKENAISSGTGNKLYLRGTANIRLATSTGQNNQTNFVFTTSGTISCDGRIDTLLDYQTVATGGTPSMAKNCYSYLFSGCTALTSAPELPASGLEEYCYYGMFSGCTSLIQAPAIPAIVAKTSCCSQMFKDCTSLVSLPLLRPMVLESTVFSSMFNGCTSIKISATQTGEYQTPYRIPTTGTGSVSTNSLSSMFSNTGGTFAEAPSINTIYYTSNTVV